MNKKQSVNIITLGCSKNLVDSEVMMGQLGHKYEVRHDSNDPSDIVVINTCGFINDAKEESVDTILRAVESKKVGDISKVFVCGCLSERYKSDLKEEITEVDGFYGVNELDVILKDLEVDYKKELIGERKVTTPTHFAYLKISEGCNRTCSFCAIPLIRGRHKSKPKEQIIGEVKQLAAKGVKELLLIAQELTYYGVDIYNSRELPDLLNKISEVDGIEWIKLHYAYPHGFPEEVLQVMAENPKVCNYVDIPLQHISDRLLSSMKRHITAEKTYQLLDKIRSTVPDVALRTTLIVGYPGETDADFEELMDFVEKTRFDRLGVFQYSHEEHTGAFLLQDDVPDEVKQDRADRIMMLQQEISNDLNKAKEGKVFKTIIDRKEGDHYVGRTEYDSPEVDNEVLIAASGTELKIGEFYEVRVEKADFFDLYGEVV
jgi:ribosomal protein S12 methylthiotransferase